MSVKLSDKYVRDKRNPGAIINTDLIALENYKKRKKIAKDNREEIETLKSDVREIKDMLKALLELK